MAHTHIMGPYPLASRLMTKRWPAQIPSPMPHLHTALVSNTCTCIHLPRCFPWHLEPALPPYSRSAWNQHPWEQVETPQLWAHGLSCFQLQLSTSVTCLEAHHSLAAFPSPSHFPTPLLVFPSATCIKICFQGTQIKIMTQGKSSKQQTPLPGSICFPFSLTGAETH